MNSKLSILDDSDDHEAETMQEKAKKQKEAERLEAASKKALAEEQVSFQLVR